MGEYGVSDRGGIIVKLEQSHAEGRMTKYQTTQSLEQQLLTLEQSLGEHHPDAIRARHKLAHAYRAANDFDEALVLFERNVAAGIRVYGPQNLFTLRMRSSLANCLYAAGRYQEAIPLFQEILRGREAALGNNHPDTLRSRGSLANSYRVTGRRQDAIDLYRDTLESRERVLGANNSSTQASRRNLAATLRVGEDSPSP